MNKKVYKKTKQEKPHTKVIENGKVVFDGLTEDYVKMVFK